MKFRVLLPIIFTPFIFAIGDKLSKNETRYEVEAINNILNGTYEKHDVKVPKKLEF